MFVCYSVELDGRAQDSRINEWVHTALDLAVFTSDGLIAFPQGLR
jgi:hypothetical protein